jgi:hypothetical protein
VAEVVLLTGVLLASSACSSQSSSQSYPALGPVASKLPRASASLTLSGAVSGKATEVRVSHCGRTTAGAATLFSSEIYFQLGKHWYDLYMDGQEKLNSAGWLAPDSSGYTGSGLYNGNAFLREMDLYPTGMVSTGSAWAPGNGLGATITIAAPNGPVSIGSITGSTVAVNFNKPPLLSKRLHLWPVMPGTVGPPPNATPGPGDLTVSGYWNCR